MSELEQLIHRTLRAQPLRTAPRNLEAKVFAEIERRAAWSGMAFVRWPLLARIAFVVVCVGVAKIMIDATLWGASQLWDALRFIPSTWITGAITFAAIMYAALFGLGAVAYRTLSIQR